jgi:hypothetical protein
VRIHDQSSTGRETGSVELEDIPAAITVRDLIRTRVRDEVARHNAAPARAFAGPVMPEGAEPGREGFMVPGRRRIDWEAQADRAVDAFTRDGFC